jgi:hypothetical protein
LTLTNQRRPFRLSGFSKPPEEDGSQKKEDATTPSKDIPVGEPNDAEPPADAMTTVIPTSATRGPDLSYTPDRRPEAMERRRLQKTLLRERSGRTKVKAVAEAHAPPKR